METGYIHYASNDRDSVSVCSARYNISRSIQIVTCPDCWDVYKQSQQAAKVLGTPESVDDLLVRLIIAREELQVHPDDEPSDYEISQIISLIDQIAAARQSHNDQIDGKGGSPC